MDQYKDPRGPRREIICVELDSNGASTKVTLSCGHVARLNQIYAYHVGWPCRCFACGMEALAQ